MHFLVMCFTKRSTTYTRLTYVRICVYLMYLMYVLYISAYCKRIYPDCNHGWYHSNHGNSKILADLCSTSKSHVFCTVVSLYCNFAPHISTLHVISIFAIIAPSSFLLPFASVIIDNPYWRWTIDNCQLMRWQFRHLYSRPIDSA
jgi:hypothetical protein